MADFTITAINQFDSQATILRSKVVAEAVTEGNCLYLDPTNSQYRIGHCETSQTTATVVGLCLKTAAATEYTDVFTRGLASIAPTTLVEDEEYFLSVTGLLMPKADIATNDWIASVGFAKSTSVLDVYIRILNKQAA